mmetsp:Transcript_74396/g.206566  ORF Transcript_74396/g.206566 Transcript_74396/m.206566 type:complete len:160 (-) Transcript_74396:8-487(-)
MSWSSGWIPRETLWVDRATVVHEGWVWKRSRHLRIWKRRWMVLTLNAELFSFEDDTFHRGATERFSVVDVRPVELCVDEPVHAHVTSSCKLNLALQYLGLGRHVSTYIEPKRATAISFDAGPSANGQWRYALQEVLTQLRQRSSQSFASCSESEWIQLT